MYTARLERKDAAVAVVLVDAVVNFRLTKKRERPLLMDSSQHFGRQMRVHGGHCCQVFDALPSVVEIAHTQIVLPELILQLGNGGHRQPRIAEFSFEHCDLLPAQERILALFQLFGNLQELIVLRRCRLDACIGLGSYCRIVGSVAGGKQQGHQCKAVNPCGPVATATAYYLWHDQQ